MSALIKKRHITDDINLVVDLTEKPNRTNLQSSPDRAIVAKIKADLILPSDKILTVDIDFDTDSGYHNNAMMVMDDFGAEMIATAFEHKYSKAHADKVRQAWNEKRKLDDPRKPTYLLVQKPIDEKSLPKIFAACGGDVHPPKDAPESII